jgi:predicted transcriptional regulator
MVSDDSTTDETDEPQSARERLEEGADKAIGEFDQSVVDLLAWLLDTETRARIYVYLRQNPDSTSEEVAEGTGLYPSTVREALAELHDEETVTRGKRESAGAGNNPYEYEAISPSELVSGAVGQVQDQLNAVFNLDDRLSRGQGGDDGGPVTISVREEATDADAGGDEDIGDAPDPAEADGGEGDTE